MNLMRAGGAQLGIKKTQMVFCVYMNALFEFLFQSFKYFFQYYGCRNFAVCCFGYHK